MHNNVFAKLARHTIILALMYGATFVALPAHQAQASDQYLLYLPLVAKTSQSNTQPTPTPPDNPPEQTAIDRINNYRALAGVQLLQLHPALVTAAQNHANYDLLNYGDQSAWTYGPHAVRSDDARPGSRRRASPGSPLR
jgi:hypothetical protein